MAPVYHTRVHVEYMNSPEFQEAQLPEATIRGFTTHVTGELMAQSLRQGGEGAPSGENIPSFRGQGVEAKPAAGGGNLDNTQKQINPALIQGGADALGTIQ